MVGFHTIRQDEVLKKMRRAWPEKRSSWLRGKVPGAVQSDLLRFKVIIASYPLLVFSLKISLRVFNNGIP